MRYGFRTAVVGLTRLLLLALAAASCAAQAPAIGEFEALLSRPVYDSSRLAAASKYEQDLASAPASVSVRTGGEIRTQGYRTLGEVLESMPGIHLRNDRSYTLTGIRGISRPGDYASRLLVLLDGVRTNEPVYDSAATGLEFPIDVAMIDRVEFIAGPGSALYGTNALLGVVNVVTRSASQMPGWQFGVEAGSARQRKLSLGWGGEAGPLRLLFGLSRERRPGRDLYYAEFDTPDDHHGVAGGRDAETTDKLLIKVRWSDFSFSAVHSERHKAVPTAAYGTLFDTPNHWRDRYSLLNLGWQGELGPLHQLQALVGLTEYRYLDTGLYGPRDDPTTSQSLSTARWLSGELRWSWLGWPQHRVMAGLEFQRSWRQWLAVVDVAPQHAVYTDVRADSTRQAVFVTDEWELHPALTLNAGLRLDQPRHDQARVTPRLAVRWLPLADWTVKLMHGRAFRQPNLNETDYADATQQRAQGLDVESLRSTEWALQWQAAAGLHLRAVHFDFKLDKLIEIVPQPGDLNVFANRGGARTRGIELESTWQAADGLQLRSSWSRQQAEDRDTGGTLSDAPRSLLKLAASGTGPWHGGRWGLNLARSGQRLTLARQPLSSSLKLNAHLRHAPAGERWHAAVGVYNLTGRRNADPAGPEHVQDRIAQEGRQLRLQFGLGF